MYHGGDSEQGWHDAPRDDGLNPRRANLPVRFLRYQFQTDT
jgi:hypothetical protein